MDRSRSLLVALVLTLAWAGSSALRDLNGLAVLHGSIQPPSNSSEAAGCVTLRLEADGWEESSQACPSTPGQPLTFALVVPLASPSQPFVGRLTATQPTGPGSELRWQHYFSLDGNGLLFHVDLNDAVLIELPAQPAHSPAALLEEPPAAVPKETLGPTSVEPQLSACTAPVEETTPGTGKQQPAWASSPPPPTVALDRSVPALLQYVNPLCRVPSASKAASSAAQDGQRSSSVQQRPQERHPMLRMLLAALQTEHAVLGLGAACLLQLLVICAMLLLRAPPPAAPAPPQTPPRPPAPQQQPFPQQAKQTPSLRRVLRDACCSPMVPAALLSVFKSPGLGKLSLASVPEDDDAEAKEMIGWARDNYGRLQKREVFNPHTNIMERHPAPFGSGGGALPRQPWARQEL